MEIPNTRGKKGRSQGKSSDKVGKNREGGRRRKTKVETTESAA